MSVRCIVNACLLSAPLWAIGYAVVTGNPALMIVGLVAFGVVLFGLDYRRLARKLRGAPDALSTRERLP